MLIPLQRATREACGGKAVGLSRLLRCGLPVPSGVCLPTAVYRAALAQVVCSETETLGTRDPVALERLSRPVVQHLARWAPDGRLRQELEQAARALGWPLALRSSATCEDGEAPELATPGLFHTANDVRDLDRLIQSIRDCWASLWSVEAWIVLQRQSSSPPREAMAVVLQHQITPRWSGMALSHAAGVRVELVPGAGAALAAGEVDPLIVELPRQGDLTSTGPLTPPEMSALRDAVLRADEEWGDGQSNAAVEVEWVLDRRLWLVQARATTVRSTSGAGTRWRLEGKAGVWRWDREHNPQPLSPMHASLMQRLDPEGRELMVVQGYLYQRSGRSGGAGGHDSLPVLWREFQARQIPVLERMEQAQATTIDQALRFFIQFHRDYFGSLARDRRRARSDLVQLLEQVGASQPSRLAAQLVESTEHATLQRTFDLLRLPTGREAAGALQRHVQRFGSLVPVWDVAVPTLAEDPRSLLRHLDALAATRRDTLAAWRRRQVAAHATRRELRRRLGPALQQELDRRLEHATLARCMAEEDDLLFSRALALLRRALLREGRLAVGLQQAADVFLLTLDEALSQQHPPAMELLQRRRGWDHQRRLTPPLVLPESQVEIEIGEGDLLRGLGVGGTAGGVVRLVTDLEQLLHRDLQRAVVVCPTLLPALAVVLPQVAALVTDHGGLLSHAASLARELSVVAVVGTGRATRVLHEGDAVWVDGTRGLVLRL